MMRYFWRIYEEKIEHDVGSGSGHATGSSHNLFSTIRKKRYPLCSCKVSQTEWDYTNSLAYRCARFDVLWRPCHGRNHKRLPNLLVESVKTFV